MKTDFQKWFFFQLKCLGKVLDALFMMIQDNKGLADFGSPCSLSTTNVKSKNQDLMVCIVKIALELDPASDSGFL